MDNARKFVHNGFANEEIYGRLADSVFGRTESEAVHNKLVPSGPVRTAANKCTTFLTPTHHTHSPHRDTQAHTHLTDTTTCHRPDTDTTHIPHTHNAHAAHIYT